MSTLTSLRESGVLSLRAWLPTAGQMRAGLKLDLTTAIDGDRVLQETLDGAPATTMQQGMGLVILSGLVAGLLPTLAHWIGATRAGTSTVLLAAANQLASIAPAGLTQPWQSIVESLQTAAGADPVFPGWLAALLSALGSWINWPLNFLSLWIVYGIVTLVVAKLFGASTTLQRFYAGAAYAALPLVLLGLSFIPWVGPLIALAAMVLALLALYRAVRVVTGLPALQSLVSALLPPGLAVILASIVAVAVVASVVRLVMW